MRHLQFSITSIGSKRFFDLLFHFFSSCLYFIPTAREELVEEGEIIWN